MSHKHANLSRMVFVNFPQDGHPERSASQIHRVIQRLWRSAQRVARGICSAPGSRTKVFVPFVLPQNRHPERSASQMDRVTKRLVRGVEGPRRCLIYPCCSELFDH
jgi:hypothetical protein